MFEEFGELEDVKILTRKTILARRLEAARKASNLSVSEMARRMGTSRMAVHSLLDSAKPTMTIDSPYLQLRAGAEELSSAAIGLG
jgi:hypothetical protein